ncbi:MAG TPA: ABC transporter ATP-binding protein, partial [Herpetosiphonaceae bacterium]|nr:ABC transporter ATP-binding protein [Herpetosiphonaceae bacterium]
MKTRHYLWHLLRFRRGLYVINLIGITMLLLLELVTGLVTRAYFDHLTGATPARLGVGGLIGLLLVASLGRGLFSFSLGLTNIPFMFQVGGLLRKNLLQHILNRPGARALPESAGEAISRFRDDIDEITGSFMWFNDLVAFGIFAAVGIILMLRISAFITLAVFVPLVVVVAIGNLVGQRVEANRIASRKAAGGVAGFLGEIMGAVQAVQVAGAEEQVTAHFHRLNEARRITSVRDRLFNELLGAVFRNTINLGTGLILILSARSIRAGSFTVGDLALFIFFLGWITEFTGLVGAFLARYRQMGVSFERMVGLLGGASPAALVAHGLVYMNGRLPELDPPRKTLDDRLQSLQVRGLTYHYPDSGRGIKDVNLHLPRGSFTVVTGRIGSGKTTLLRAVLGLLPPDYAEVYWNGVRVEDPSTFLVPPRCAYTPQVPRLFSETLRDNVLLG